MEGEWKFFRETGQLWQIGNFKKDMKNGKWLRYDKNNKLEYREIFKDNKIEKNTLTREK
jgi:antitoxin component YwqK of YwqJK toxin-antitoxin module